MSQAQQPSVGESIARGMVGGVAGPVVMTAFQQFVEVPLSGREASYAPADFAENILPLHPDSPQARQRLNWMTHFALGTVWGTAYGITAHTGLRGPKAIAVVFATVSTTDVLLNTALGLHQPTTWTKQDWAIDLVNKFVKEQPPGCSTTTSSTPSPPEPRSTGAQLQNKRTYVQRAGATRCVEDFGPAQLTAGRCAPYVVSATSTTPGYREPIGHGSTDLRVHLLSTL